ncbi:Thaumatin [Parasponia andersonii]|uniref:Thaumatin n=1 Tax=Parasponia andersonii TaxID=3476 RepID=A0A2P5AG01_PARAD|nr:Thaumatin [Parasponia andersonii]
MLRPDGRVGFGPGPDAASMAAVSSHAPQLTVPPVSIVDGFNLPVALAPQGWSSVRPSTGCSGNVNTVCPAELEVRGSDGSMVTCKSTCLALNQPQYCCTEDFGTLDKCPPTDYSKIVKTQ